MSAKGIALKSDFRERARVNDIPVARLIGFEAKEIANGRTTVMLPAGPQHAHPMGRLHGGILCDIADAPMGMAFASTLAPEESFTTVELRVNFFRPIWQAQLKAEGSVVQRGCTIGYVECDITHEENRLVAKAASTCRVLRGQKSLQEGRSGRRDICSGS
jgi:uncharacterized protein (TIGR00369 family)